MSNDPSEIRAQIEKTRASLSNDVDALADQATPGAIAQRQMTKVKESGTRVLDRIMGSAEDLRDAAADKVHGLADGASDVADSVASVPDAARRQAQGNPLAAAAIAFGVGLLIAAAFPDSRKETELALELKDKAQPLTDQVTAAGKEVVDNLAIPVKEAAEAFKDSAKEAARAVQAEGAEAVADVQDVVQDGASDVASSAQEAIEDVKSQPAVTNQYRI